MSSIQCAECGVEVPQSEAYYADNAQQVCIQCFNAAEVASGFLNGYRGLASTTVLAAFLSVCFNPLYILTVIAISSGVGTLRYPHHLDAEEQRLLADHPWPKVAAIVGLVVAVIMGGLHLLGDIAWLTLS